MEMWGMVLVLSKCGIWSQFKGNVGYGLNLKEFRIWP